MTQTLVQKCNRFIQGAALFIGFGILAAAATFGMIFIGGAMAETSMIAGAILIVPGAICGYRYLSTEGRMRTFHPIAVLVSYAGAYVVGLIHSLVATKTLAWILVGAWIATLILDSALNGFPFLQEVRRRAT